MPTLENIGVEDLPAWLVWTLAVQLAAFAVFSSFWGRELRSRLDRRFAPTLVRLKRMTWELQHGVEFHERAARGDALAPRRALTLPELAERRRAVRRDQWRSLPVRWALYLLTCPNCQAFWAAVGLQALVPGLHGRMVLGIATALAYSGSCGLISGLVQRAKGGCGG